LANNHRGEGGGSSGGGVPNWRAAAAVGRAWWEPRVSCLYVVL